MWVRSPDEHLSGRGTVCCLHSTAVLSHFLILHLLLPALVREGQNSVPKPGLGSSFWAGNLPASGQ